MLAQSEQGKGSTFSFILPARPRAPEKRTSTVPTRAHPPA
jgi:hypothetical protein